MVRIKRSYRIQVCGARSAPNGELPSDYQSDMQCAASDAPTSKSPISLVILPLRAQASRRCETQAPLSGKPPSYASVSVPGPLPRAPGTWSQATGRRTAFRSEQRTGNKPKGTLDTKSPIQVRIQSPPAESPRTIGSCRTLQVRRRYPDSFPLRIRRRDGGGGSRKLCHSLPCHSCGALRTPRVSLSILSQRPSRAAGPSSWKLEGEEEHCEPRSDFLHSERRGTSCRQPNRRAGCGRKARWRCSSRGPSGGPALLAGQANRGRDCGCSDHIADGRSGSSRMTQGVVDLARYWNFESVSLQRGVCELSVPERQTISK